MHSCVHRDLKLENILFDKHENVKLVDFGFTREYEGRTNHLQTFCGTICYAAPEMLRGEKYAGEKVDVWSLGVILYALLCGELPFDDDDDAVTRTRILSQEPKYPDHLPADAVPLLKALLSKRPFPRPSLQDILANPFLAEHAPAQQAILAVRAQPPFSTALENECLQRMRSAGVEVDSVIDSVSAQKCDALSGWWTLLLEKEERKMRRREKKRREKDMDRNQRRLSASSSRLERLAPTLQDVDEDGGLTGQFIRFGDPTGPRSRGRSERRSAQFYGDSAVSDLPGLPEANQEGLDTDDLPPTPIDKDSIRSVSTSRHRRPIPPPKEGVIRSARSRGSTLHLVATPEPVAKNAGIGSRNARHPQDMGGQQKTKKKPSQAIIAHWKNWTHWFIENTRRRRGHERRMSRSTPNLHLKDASSNGSKDASPRPQTSKTPTSGSPAAQAKAPLPKGVVANGHAARGQAAQGGNTVRSTASRSSLSTPSHQHSLRPRIATSQPYKRQSPSPSPLTPRSAVRRSSTGLRGRKSTSSSVSSVRSMHHHHHSHSKASSTSSAGSVSTCKTPLGRGQSPHHSVKVLPATPTSSSFPSNIRLVLGSPGPAPRHVYNEGMPDNQSQPFGSPNPFTSGVLFAKRKKNLFKGPTLNFGAGGSGSSRRASAGVHSRSGSGSALGRRSGEITIQEEDENAMGQEPELECEEVEVFNPIVGGPGEKIEEHVIEDEETTPAANVDIPAPQAAGATLEAPAGSLARRAGAAAPT